VKRLRGALVVLAAASLVAVSGCSGPGPSSASPPASQPAPPGSLALPRVSLPDLSGMAPPVQQQLRDQFAVLVRAEDSSTMPADERARAYGEMGKLLLAAESYVEAESCFLGALALSPGDVRWTYYLGQLSRIQGESQKAAMFFERVLKARPDDVATLVWLGNVYLDQGRPMDARPLFSRALALDPRTAAARVGLGRVALAAHDYATAIDQLEAGLAMDRSATSIHYLLATAYRGAGRIEQAEAHLRQRGPVPVGPPDPLMQEAYELLKSPALYEMRGDRALARGEFDKAVALFRSGLDLSPDSLTLRQKLATALSLHGDVAASVQQLQEVLRRSPKFASAHYSLGVLLLSSGQLDLAIERFALAVQYDPSYVPARLQLANMLRQRGKFALAQDQYATVIKSDPRLAEAQFGQAVALVGLKRYEEARDRLSEGLQLYPDRLEFPSALVRLYAAAPEPRVRDGTRALALAQELVKKSDTPPAREAMAMALAETGQYGAAIRWQRDAIAAATESGQTQLARRMGDDLKLYERQQPSRVPWREEPTWQ
jgi:tetratricopeptide (TPR) repeat protein